MVTGNLPAASVSGLATVATSGSFSDLSNTPVLTGNVSYTVNASGTGNYATIQAALDALSGYVMPETCNVTLNLADGIYTSASPVLMQTSVLSRVYITGNTYAKSLSSVVSSSGSGGNYSLVLQLNNVSSLYVGMYVIISGLQAEQIQVSLPVAGKLRRSTVGRARSPSPVRIGTARRRLERWRERSLASVPRCNSMVAVVSRFMRAAP